LVVGPTLARVAPSDPDETQVWGDELVGSDDLTPKNRQPNWAVLIVVGDQL
jgi:hypothetical protein